MKKNLFRLLLLWVAVLMSSSLLADVTFKFKAPSSWSKCQLWAWDDDKKQLDGNTSWPGNVAMTLGSDGYYTYTLTGNFSKVNFLFNNGASSSTQQTVDYATTKTAFQGKAGSQNSEGKYNIVEETFVPDTPDTPDTPSVTGDVVISAIRNRLSINTNNFTDFAGLYVSALPKAGDASVSYEWQYSTNQTTWSKYSLGDGATWDNIRPNTAGYYRCVLSYDLAGQITTYTSNVLQITHSGGSSVSYSSKLPVILVRTAKDFPSVDYLDNDGVAALKAKRSVDVKILWNEDGGAITQSDINNAEVLHYDRKARMNYRGSSSLRNSKKSYAFVSGDKNCDAKKLGEVKTKKFGMFGAEAQKDWVLYASAPDETYMRNILSYHQYAQMTGLWGVKCRYVELYIDGEYKGIYVFMDKVTQDENRVNINEDTGYIVKFDKTDMVDSYDGTSGYNEDYKRNTFITANTGKRNISTYDQFVDQAFEIEYPEREDIAEFDDNGNVVNDAPWNAKVAEIKGMFTNMENAILANDYAKLATLIDYDSWADWFIMNEFSRNADAYRISCVFMVNSASDKIVANPIWDYELGWGNQDTKTTGLMVEDNQYYSDDFPTPFWWTGKGKSGCNGILGDCKFRAKVQERLEKHLGTNGALNATVLNAKIDSLQTVLGSSSKNTSVSTSSLKSWVTNRTSGLKSAVNAWEVCPELKFALIGTINGAQKSGYAAGIPFTIQNDGSYAATFVATTSTQALQMITSTGNIWARNDSKDIVSTHQDAASYATMTNGQKTGYANITTEVGAEYQVTFLLNANNTSGKLTYTKIKDGYDVTIAAIRNRLSINTNNFTDFAGLYVSALPKAGDASVSYEWQYSTNQTTWSKYSLGDGATWDNIRPNTAGYYRCVLTYDLAGQITTYTSNVLQITHNGGSAVSYSSGLPVVLVRTAKDFPAYPGDYPNIEQVEELKAKRSVDVKILWNEDGGSITQSDINNADVLHYDRKARMNYRGSSSLYNPKRSYAFVSGDKNCDAKKLGEVKTKKFGMFGQAAHKDWVLYASYPDATYMRNVLSYHQYAQMTGMWGVKCRYVELYIDGEYQGIYVFMDKITQDENRVNINEDTGYIVKFDKTDIADRYAGKAGANEDSKRCTFTTSNTGKTGISTYNITVDQAFEIEYPEREDIAEFDDDGNVVNDAPWDAKVAEIKGVFENMERAILANDYDKLATLIDYDSWADWFIMNEFSRNADAYRISCVFTVNSASDKIVANPIWDYELGWGNQDTKTTGLMVEDNKYYSDDFPTPFWWTGKGKSGCDGILGDCKFRAKVQERLEKHLGANGALNATVLNAKIDSLQTVLGSSSKSTSVSTTSLKSWVTNRTSGLKSAVNAWEVCPEPDPYTVTPTFTHVTCHGDNNGAITLEVSGSVAPYTYTWTYPNGSTATTKDLADLTAG
ncbi:MAG: CotH kinase family protein, partial [Paludibacteraceae bacterium]|nr:CotH kinase family protein [Paludibacteraceae bacterium]